MVVVVVHILGRIDWQHQVVGSQPVPLGVCVTENTRLQHLVITVPKDSSTTAAILDCCSHDGMRLGKTCACASWHHDVVMTATIKSA